MELPGNRAALAPRSGSISYATTVPCLGLRPHRALEADMKESLVADHVRGRPVDRASSALIESPKKVLFLYVVD